MSETVLLIYYNLIIALILFVIGYEPLQKQIEKLQRNNPELKMRNLTQLNTMKFKGVYEWHKEQKQLKAEREQQKHKRELERKLDRGFSL